MMTPKRNSCVTLAFSNTHLKMYGKGTKIDEIRESTTIDSLHHADILKTETKALKIGLWSCYPMIIRYFQPMSTEDNVL